MQHKFHFSNFSAICLLTSKNAKHIIQARFKISFASKKGITFSAQWKFLSPKFYLHGHSTCINFWCPSMFASTPFCALMKTLTAIDSHSLWLVSRIALNAGNFYKNISWKAIKWFDFWRKTKISENYELFQLMLSDILGQCLLTIKKKKNRKIFCWTRRLFMCILSVFIKASFC